MRRYRILLARVLALDLRKAGKPTAILSLLAMNSMQSLTCSFASGLLRHAIFADT